MKTYVQFINEGLPTSRPRKKPGTKKDFKSGEVLTVNKKGDKLDGKKVTIVKSVDNGAGDMYSVSVDGSSISVKFHKDELVKG